MNVLKPRQPVPALEVETLGGSWSLADQQPENFTMIVFYRGLHCPICGKYVPELDKLLDDFAEIGVNCIVVSTDQRERAEQAKADWGLHRSSSRGKTSIGIEEPAEFNEPGLFIVRADGTLYWAQVSTMPFARPHFREILGALKFALEKDYPARGELS